MKEGTGNSYKVVSLVDVNQLLSFAKNEYGELEEQIKEEKRVEKELKEFIIQIERHSGHKIHYMGHEKRYGKHLVRFMMHGGGFLEVMVEKPLVINGHFITRHAAEKFMGGLKKALERVLPESHVKKMFIESIKVEDGFKDEVVTLDKWEKMHRIVIRKTLALTIIAILLFLMFEIIQESMEFFTLRILHIEVHSIVVSIVTAIIVSLMIEPLKEKIDGLVERIFL